MNASRRRFVMLIAATLTVTGTTAAARATLSPTAVLCVDAVAKGGRVFVKRELAIRQRCKSADLKNGSCPVPDAIALQKEAERLGARIGAACSFGGNVSAQATILAMLGYAELCPDATPGDDFTTVDLIRCIQASHEAAIDQLLDLEYDPSITELQTPELITCQSRVAKGGAALADCLLKYVQRCRTNIMKGRVDVPPQYCAIAEPTTQVAVDRCRGKTEAAIASTCTDDAASALALCTPDQTDAAAAAACIAVTHTRLIDDPTADEPFDLIDIEYGTVILLQSARRDLHGGL